VERREGGRRGIVGSGAEREESERSRVRRARRESPKPGLDRIVSTGAEEIRLGNRERIARKA